MENKKEKTIIQIPICLNTILIYYEQLCTQVETNNLQKETLKNLMKSLALISLIWTNQERSSKLLTGMDWTLENVSTSPKAAAWGSWDSPALNRWTGYRFTTYLKHVKKHYKPWKTSLCCRTICCLDKRICRYASLFNWWSMAAVGLAGVQETCLLSDIWYPSLA